MGLFPLISHFYSLFLPSFPPSSFLFLRGWISLEEFSQGLSLPPEGPPKGLFALLRGRANQKDRLTFRQVGQSQCDTWQGNVADFGFLFGPAILVSLWNGIYFEAQEVSGSL